MGTEGQVRRRREGRGAGGGRRGKGTILGVCVVGRSCCGYCTFTACTDDGILRQQLGAPACVPFPGGAWEQRAGKIGVQMVGKMEEK